jgi:hypothetical protein
MRSWSYWPRARTPRSRHKDFDVHGVGVDRGDVGTERVPARWDASRVVSTFATTGTFWLPATSPVTSESAHERRGRRRAHGVERTRALRSWRRPKYGPGFWMPASICVRYRPCTGSFEVMICVATAANNAHIQRKRNPSCWPRDPYRCGRGTSRNSEDQPVVSPTTCTSSSTYSPGTWSGGWSPPPRPVNSPRNSLMTPLNSTESVPGNCHYTQIGARQ